MKKRAEDLRPGDILAAVGPREPRAVILKILGTRPLAPAAIGGVVVDALVAPLDDGPERRANWEFSNDVDVEAPALTLVQQHAEELLEMVRRLASGTHVQVDAQALLARIDPPQPVTVGEVLDALAAAAKYANLNVDSLDPEDREASYQAEQTAGAILKRARRAGQLPTV